VKSIEKAIELQTEYAKTSYETFVAESQKIGELYTDLASRLSSLTKAWSPRLRRLLTDLVVVSQ
jgi:hypothetical protein